MVVENFEAVSLLDVVVSRFVAEGGQPKNLDKKKQIKFESKSFYAVTTGGGSKGPAPSPQILEQSKQGTSAFSTNAQ